MKHILLTSLIVLLIAGCQKNLDVKSNNYVETVRKGLQDSLSTVDFQSLDFKQASRSRVDSIELYYLRVPFSGKKEQEDFVLVKTNKTGKIESGRIIHLKGGIEVMDNRSDVAPSWNGNISISSLDRKSQMVSPILNGYITLLHQRVNNRTSSLEPYGHVMPEVIVTYVRTSGNSFSWSSWFMLQSPSWGGGGGNSGSYFTNFFGGDGSGGGGGGGNPNGGGYVDPVIQVDMETHDNNPSIDIQKYVSCFNSIPDAGSTCSIEISTDIPVDANPNAFFDFGTGSPGHVFVTIKKMNGSQYVSQNIGFYPTSGYKAMTYTPTAGKLVDNAGHEFNASLSMNITHVQLATALTRVQQLSNLNYDIDNFNCTDWALEIFNSVRTNKLEIPLYILPGSNMSLGAQTPQGLFHKLQQLVDSNSPEKNNVTIGIVKGYAGGSKGPCN